MSDPGAGDFSLGQDFEQALPSGGLGLGALESQYEELFAEVLEDGIITEEERARLEKVAQNLGLDRGRLVRLEEAMTAAYETHHRLRIVDLGAKKHASIGPLVTAPPLSVPARAALAAGAPAAQALTAEEASELQSLRAEVQALRAKVGELTLELERAQAALNVEVDLTEIEAAAASVQSPEDAWKQVRHDPHDPAAYRVLAEAYAAAGTFDGQVLTAQALVALGAATPEERALAESHAQTGLIAPARSIDPTLWQSCLFHPEEEPLTGAIFSVVAPAILIGRVTTLRRDGKKALPTEDRQDPATSTVMAVRAIPWGAAILGLGVPPIYVSRAQETAYQHDVAVPPATSIGQKALRGRTTTELAFLVGRHLSGYRAEHFVKVLYSSTEDLEDLFLAALVIANPPLPLRPSHRARVEPLARAIEPLLEPARLDALRGHYLRFAEEGGRTNLQRWSFAVDRTAARVGLGLSQDLGAALSVLAEEEGPLGPLAVDLLTFATSERFLRLRRSLGLSSATG